MAHGSAAGCAARRHTGRTKVETREARTSHTRHMAQCWSSGGPLWLFDLTLYAGIMVPVAAVWWILAWSKWPPTKTGQPRSKVILDAAPGFVLVGVVLLSWQGLPPSVIDIGTWAGVAIITVGMVAVYRHRVGALAAGGELSRGWQRAALTTRWAAPAVTIALALVSVGAFTTYLAMGHPIPC